MIKWGTLFLNINISTITNTNFISLQEILSAQLALI
jgi:hypothetical protein